ncbi:MAG: gluconate 2-dehydrogenase subunit 3 family protein [Terriglobia bacterium]
MADDPTRQERPNSEADGSVTSENADITRREWLLRLGGTAVLVGFHGMPAAGEAGLAPGQAAPAASETASHQPGLYEPSQDHMTHALTADDRFHPIPIDSPTDFIRPSTSPFQPQFFSPAEFPVVQRLVALVLGESGDSVEGKVTVSEVSEWIDLEVSDSAAVREAALKLSPQHRALDLAFRGGDEEMKTLETRDPQKTWREGLEWISTESSRRWSKDFIDAPEAPQIDLLKSMSVHEQAENAGTRLFVLLKSQVANGFYTSQRGLKELDYKGNAFYAECPGCDLPRH